MKFTQLPFNENVLKGIKKANFIECTKVQEKVLPVSLENKDLMVQSKTGSGKTAVYLLTILQRIAISIENNQPLEKALIVAPTRELAVQIKQDAKLLSSELDVNIGVFYGGVGYEKQEKQLKNCDIFVGTPGRLLDFQKSKKIDFKKFDIFVLDEADRMFDMGFYPDVKKMFSLLKNKDKMQTMLFSATLSLRVRNLAWEYMSNPIEIEVEPEEICVEKITQELYHVSKEEKFIHFLYLMKRENSENALIFTNTKAKAIELAKRLSLNGFNTKYLMGDLSQSKRLNTIKRMKEGQIKYLVATDVAARGLQIDDLQLVINYDIPEDFESYVHRIGRTARAGKTGKAITLACEEFIYGLEPIENYIEMKIPVEWVDEDELAKIEDKSKDYKFRDLVSEKEYASRRSTPSSRNKRSPNSSNRNYKNKKSDRSYDRNRNNDRNKDRNNNYKNKKNYDKDSRVKKEYPRNKNKKEYNEIRHLSIEERLNYYKTLYGDDKLLEKSTNSKNPKKPLQKGQKPAKVEVKKTTSNSNRKAVKPQSAESNKKKGLFSRFFSKLLNK
ncbi:MAG: DEAD/DEAH box helicase [Pleomorphochaeta sp.]